mgnify:CR=1 FL=1
MASQTPSGEKPSGEKPSGELPHSPSADFRGMREARAREMNAVTERLEGLDLTDNLDGSPGGDAVVVKGKLRMNARSRLRKDVGKEIDLASAASGGLSPSDKSPGSKTDSPPRKPQKRDRANISGNGGGSLYLGQPAVW